MHTNAQHTIEQERRMAQRMRALCHTSDRLWRMALAFPARSPERSLYVALQFAALACAKDIQRVIDPAYA
jgi:hypothetical protein